MKTTQFYTDRDLFLTSVTIDRKRYPIAHLARSDTSYEATLHENGEITIRIIDQITPKAKKRSFETAK